MLERYLMPKINDASQIWEIYFMNENRKTKVEASKEIYQVSSEKITQCLS